MTLESITQRPDGSGSSHSLAALPLRCELVALPVRPKVAALPLRCELVALPLRPEIAALPLRCEFVALSYRPELAALPRPSAVRLCLTGSRPLTSFGGYASKAIASILLVAGLSLPVAGQKKRVPPGGHIAVVADERLAALRSAPDSSARLLRRLSRGRLVSIRRSSRSRDGLLFFHVAVTRRTTGWLQSEALVSAGRQGDDRRLAHLISGADEFDRIARARVFLDTFPRSPLRPKVLLLLGDAAEEAAARLSREAERRFERREIPTDGAPEFSYFLNYSGLDRYNRQGVTFVFDRTAKHFHYDGAAWQEILKRHPNSPEAVEARKRLEKLKQLR